MARHTLRVTLGKEEQNGNHNDKRYSILIGRESGITARLRFSQDPQRTFAPARS